MLIKWIDEGNLQDPYKEFMVRESSHITKGLLVSDYTDEYWERRYTLRDGSNVALPGKNGHGNVNGGGGGGQRSGKGLPNSEVAMRPGTNRYPGGACIPPFLEPWKHKILLAGKYLNVIKECGLEIVHSEPQEEEEEEGEAKVSSQESSLATSSSAMIKMDDPK